MTLIRFPLCDINNTTLKRKFLFFFVINTLSMRGTL